MRDKITKKDEDEEGKKRAPQRTGRLCNISAYNDA